MTAELYLMVVDDPEADPEARRAGGSIAAAVQSFGSDAQLLPNAPAGPAPAHSAPPVFVGELPRDAEMIVADGTPPIALRVEAVLANAARVIDEALIEQVLLAFDADGAPDHRVGSPVDVWRFLRAHEGARVRTVRRPGAEQIDVAIPVTVAPVETARNADVAEAVNARSAVGKAPPDGGVTRTGTERWGAVADWLTLATLRAVVIGIVALHLFVLIGEAIIATP